MHPASILPEDRLRHERRYEPKGPRYVFHDESERRDVISGFERVSIAKVDLVLSVRRLMVSGFDLETHALEHVDDCAAGVFPKIRRRQIEIRSDIMRNCRC